MKLTVKNDALLAANYTFPGPNGGLIDNRTGKVITAENVQVPSLGYLPRHSVESAVIRHNNRQIREASKPPVTSHKKRRELSEVRNAVREEKKRKKEEREAAKKENVEFFKRLDSSNTNYREKVAQVMRDGKYQKVGAMVRYSIKKGVPVAYVDRYGYYMTLDGITWRKLQDHREAKVNHRSPANRHSRGECMILIPIEDKPEQESRLGKTRLSITGWTEEEFKIAMKAVQASRGESAPEESKPAKKPRKAAKKAEEPEQTKEQRLIANIQKRYFMDAGRVSSRKTGYALSHEFTSVDGLFVSTAEIARALRGEVPKIERELSEGEDRVEVDDRLNVKTKAPAMLERLRKMGALDSTNS